MNKFTRTFPWQNYKESSIPTLLPSQYYDRTDSGPRYSQPDIQRSVDTTWLNHDATDSLSRLKAEGFELYSQTKLMRWSFSYEYPGNAKAFLTLGNKVVKSFNLGHVSSSGLSTDLDKIGERLVGIEKDFLAGKFDKRIKSIIKEAKKELISLKIEEVNNNSAMNELIKQIDNISIERKQLLMSSTPGKYAQSAELENKMGIIRQKIENYKSRLASIKKEVASNHEVLSNKQIKRVSGEEQGINNTSENSALSQNATEQQTCINTSKKSKLVNNNIKKSHNKTAKEKTQVLIEKNTLTDTDRYIM